jgi:hypothetical protein
LATIIALSNSAIAPSTWRTSLEVGPSSRKELGLSAAAALPQPFIADLLHHDIAGEAVGGLDDDGADTVALDPLQYGGEAGRSTGSAPETAAS